jgi:hypothetical protein
MRARDRFGGRVEYSSTHVAVADLFPFLRCCREAVLDTQTDEKVAREVSRDLTIKIVKVRAKVKVRVTAKASAKADTAAVAAEADIRVAVDTPVVVVEVAIRAASVKSAKMVNSNKVVVAMP